MGLLEKVCCNFCGQSKSKFLFRATDRQYNSVPPNVWCNVVRCKKCGLVYLNPRVKEKYIEKFYPEKEYYTQTDIKKSNKLKKIKDDLFRMIACLYFGCPKGKINFQSKLNHLLLKQLAIITFKLFPFRYRRLVPYISEGRILDFGFGRGGYLRRMKDLGWECWGIEKEEKTIKEINEKKILAFSNLWDSKIPKDYFDWLTAYHSIEHVYSPKEVIRRMFAILKPGGRIYIGTPNFDSLAARLFKSYWYNLSVPIHLQIFTKNSIINFLEARGFRDIKIYHRSTTQGILGSIQNVVNAFISRLLKKKYTKMFLRDNLILHLLFIPIIKILDWLHLGDRIEVIATKPRYHSDVASEATGQDSIIDNSSILWILL